MSSVARITRRGHGIRAFDRVDEQAGHLVAHLLDRLADAGEGGLGRGRDRRVVEADDGDVLGDASTGGRQDRQGAGGHEVRGGEDGIDVGARGEEPFHRRTRRRPG